MHLSLQALDEQHAAGGEGQSAIKRFFKVVGR
jgi:hypothetical protein